MDNVAVVESMFALVNTIVVTVLAGEVVEIVSSGFGFDKALETLL